MFEALGYDDDLPQYFNQKYFSDKLLERGDIPEDLGLALDSGAYRAFRQGKNQLVSLNDYGAIAMSYPFDFVVSPDVIGDWERSYNQWKSAVELIDSQLLPVWQWGAPMEILEEMLAASALVGIGGCQPWLRCPGQSRIHNLALLRSICEHYSNRLHLFGLHWTPAIDSLKDVLASGDSSHFLCRARNGLVLHEKRGTQLSLFTGTVVNSLYCTPARLLDVAQHWNRSERCINNAKVLASYLGQPSFRPLAVA